MWDEIKNRLYFADCAAGTLHWLEDGSTTPETLSMPSTPAGLVLTVDGSLVVALDDGLYLVEPDQGRTQLLSAYPASLGGRCNDACADLEGNIITGKLNLGPGEGSAWQYSKSGAWTMLDNDIQNTNGPAALVINNQSTLIVGDTGAHYYAYDYDASAATVGPRRVFGDVSELEGSPDGSAIDFEGGLWCAMVVGGSQLVRFTTEGFDRSIKLPCLNPTDLTFGGPDLDRLYITSIGSESGYGGDSEFDGSLLVIEGLGITGRNEPRAVLDS